MQMLNEVLRVSTFFLAIFATSAPLVLSNPVPQMTQNPKSVEENLKVSPIAEKVTEQNTESSDIGEPPSPQPQPDLPEGEQTSEETRVLVVEVVVEGVEGELEDLVYKTITTKPGYTSTRSQLQEDVNNIYSKGYFSNVKVVPEDTPLGVRVTFVVKANPIFSKLFIETIPNIKGKRVLPSEVVQKTFQSQYGKIINLADLQNGIKEINQWYSQNGYDLAQVVGAPKISEDGIVTVSMAEGVIQDIQVRFFNEEDEPVEGKTRDFVVIREMNLKPGDVFNRNTAQQDLQRVFGLDIFEDIKLSFSHGDNPSEVIVNVDPVESKSISLVAGLEINTTTGVYGSVDYTDNNLGGRNQKLTTKLELNASKITLDFSLTNPGAMNRTPVNSPCKNVGGTAVNTEIGADVNNSVDIDKFTNSIENLVNPESSDKNLKVCEQEIVDAVKIAKGNGRDAEVALLLNNLGNLYMSSGSNKNLDDYLLAIDTYQQAGYIFHNLNSPGLELLMNLRLAEVYRAIGQPVKALKSYQDALNLSTILEDKATAKEILGESVIKVFKTEWQIESEQLDEKVTFIFPLLKTTILLEMGGVYSALGDYQQALYVATSPQLSINSSSLASKIPKFWDDLKQILSSKIDYPRTNNNTNDENTIGNRLIQYIFETLNNKQLISIENEISILSNKLPNISQSLALDFIYSDLNESEKANFYARQAQQIFDGLTALTKKILSDLFLSPKSRDFAIKEIPNFFESANLNNEVKEAIITLYDVYIDILNKEINNPERKSKNDFDKPEVKKAINVITNALSDFLLAEIEPQESSNLDSQELAELQSFLKVLIPKFIELVPSFIDSIITNSLFTKADSDSSSELKPEQILPFTEAILSSWPSDSKTFQNFVWLKGVVFAIQGNLYNEKGQLKEAIRAYESAIPLLTLKSKNFEDSLNLLSKDAKSSIQPFLPIVNNILDRFIVEAFLNSGDLYLKVQEPSKAKSSYLKALSLGEELSKKKILNFSQALIAEILYKLAQADLALGNLELAQNSIELAIDINQKAFPKASLSGEEAFAQLQLKYGNGLANQGSISGKFNISSENPWVKPNKSDNNDDSLFLWQEYCNTSAEYFACKQKYFDFYINLLLERYKQSPSKRYDVLAFEASERARVQGPQAFQVLKTSDGDTSKNLWLKQRRDKLNTSASLEDIQQQILDDETILLEYFLGQDKSYLWVVTKNKPLQTIELPARSVIEKKARHFYDFLTVPSNRVKPKTTALIGQELSEMLLGKVTNQLGEKRLLIVADGFIQYIPFSVLPNLAPKTLPSQSALQGEFAPVLNPLLIEHEIVMLPSASSLVALRQSQANRVKPIREITIFADPVFNHRDERVKQVTIAPNFSPLEKDSLNSTEAIYSQLPNTAQELDFVNDSILSKGQKKMLIGYDANLQSTLDPNLGTSRIVHFATHGIFNNNSPERSGIVLSSINERGEIQPGLLSPYYAFNEMNLASTELVVLSGCRTGLSSGEINREGLTGLTGGLFAAGTDRIVASLWSVQDKATQELITRFYKYMLDSNNPLSPSQALRKAQIDMWNDPRWQNPYNWAAFFIQGEWR
jgi:CHAT domain-containing protein